MNLLRDLWITLICNICKSVKGRKALGIVNSKT